MRGLRRHAYMHGRRLRRRTREAATSSSPSRALQTWRSRRPGAPYADPAARPNPGRFSTGAAAGPLLPGREAGPPAHSGGAGFKRRYVHRNILGNLNDPERGVVVDLQCGDGSGQQWTVGADYQASPRRPLIEACPPKRARPGGCM